MNRQKLTILITLFLSFRLFSQSNEIRDFIVTSAGDTIYVDKIKKKYDKIIVKKDKKKTKYSSEKIQSYYLSKGDEYYEKVRRLLHFFNAKCLYENERKGMYQYLEFKNQTHLLLDQPGIIKDVVQNSKVNRGKGMHMSKPLKDYGEELIKMWLLEQYGKEDCLNLHKIRSIPLLKELISYNETGNFDRVMAFMMVMYHLQEVKKIKVEKETKVTTIYDQGFWGKQLYKRGRRKF